MPVFLESKPLQAYSAEYRTATQINSVAVCLCYGCNVIKRSDCLFFLIGQLKKNLKHGLEVIMSRTTNKSASSVSVYFPISYYYCIFSHLSFPRCDSLKYVSQLHYNLCGRKQKQNVSGFHFKLHLINIVQRPHVNNLIELAFQLTIDLSFNKFKILQMPINQSVS